MHFIKKALRMLLQLFRLAHPKGRRKKLLDYRSRERRLRFYL